MEKINQTTKILVAVCVVIAITALVWAVVFKREQRLPSEYDVVLGAWQQVATSSDSDSFAPQYIGFIAGSDGNTMRTYGDSSLSTTTLTELNSWTIGNSPSGMILNEIASSTPQLLVLQVLDENGDALGSPIIYDRVRSAQSEAQLSFKRTPEENAVDCETILSGSSTADALILLPISCTASLGKENVTIAFDAEGNLSIRSGSKMLFAMPNGFSAAGEDASTTIESTEASPFLNPAPIIWQDVTGDGYPDVAVLTSLGAYNAFYDYYAFDPATGIFDPTPILTDIVNPAVDTKAGTITSFDLGRGLGDIYDEETYTLNDGTYVLTSTESQDFANENGYSESDPLYIQIDQKLEHGIMTTTSVEYRIADQLGYDY